VAANPKTFVASISLVRGVKADGTEVFYTGRAGDGFVSPDRADAFYGYTLEGARRQAAVLNQGTGIHGIRFVAVVPHDDFDLNDFDCRR
jgi:hypothetical protein